MALKLSVKIGDVTNLSDARYAAGMGVDYIGFNLEQNSNHYLSPKAFKEIVDWISGVGIIGEIGVDLPNEDYGPFLRETSSDALLQQWHEGVLRINATQNTWDAIAKLIAGNEHALFFILELNPNQIMNDTNVLKTLCNKGRIYISTELNEELLQIIINEIKPTGIEIKGSIEEQPGLKDYDGISDILELLEED